MQPNFLQCSLMQLNTTLDKIENGDRKLDEFITKTCSCNIQRIFSQTKIENFIGKKKMIFFIVLLKTKIVGAH